MNIRVTELGMKARTFITNLEMPFNIIVTVVFGFVLISYCPPKTILKLFILVPNLKTNYLFYKYLSKYFILS